jgi:hypothetical protein
MRTVRGIECYEQSDLCKNTNIVWAVSKLINQNGGEITGCFVINFIPEGKRKPVRHTLLPLILPIDQSQSSQTIKEIIEVFESYGVKAYYYRSFE